MPTVKLYLRDSTTGITIEAPEQYNKSGVWPLKNAVTQLTDAIVEIKGIHPLLVLSNNTGFQIVATYDDAEEENED
jgi:hypothetical protein